MVKKVCHMTSAHNRYDVRIFQKQCKSLAKKGYDITLLVADGKEDEIIDSVKIKSIKFVAKNRIDRIINSKREMFKNAIDIDADIYQFHDPELLSVGLRLKKKGKNVIFDSHENYTEQILYKEYIPKFLRRIISKIYNMIETKICRQIDAVIFPNALNGMHVFEGRAKKSIFIDNFPLIEEFNYYQDEKKILKEKAVIYVGSLTEYRGITNLIKAVSRANYKLILAGKFHSQEYFSELKKMPEYSCVDYRGIVDRKEIVSIIQSSMIGIATILNVGQYNKYDGFATKVYEYMAMGLPVIISDYEYSRKVFLKENCGICVNPENVEDIIKSITYLIENPIKAKQMGCNGRRLILEKYNWSTQEKKLIELYESL